MEATVRVTNEVGISRVIKELYVERLCMAVICVLSTICEFGSRDKCAFHAQNGLSFRYLCSRSLLPPSFTPKSTFLLSQLQTRSGVCASVIAQTPSKQEATTQKFHNVSFHLKPKDILQYFSLLYVSCRLS